MFLPASLIINCFLIHDWRYRSERLALSSADVISFVIKSRSDCLNLLSSTAAKTASSSPSSSDLNLNKSQLENRRELINTMQLFFNHNFGYPFLFILINLDAIIFLQRIHELAI